MKKILLLNKVSKKATEIFKKEGYEVDEINQLSPNELKNIIKQYDIIGIRSKTNLTDDILQNASKLMAIAHFCIGTDQTDLESANRLGIPVFNSPFENTRSVAELVICYMIMLSRKIGDKNIEMHNNYWNKTSNNCFELRGKTLGIVGYGSIGSQLSQLAENMGMNIIFYDILPKLRYNNAIKMNSFNELLQKSDFVSFHVPLTHLTENMINKDNIQNMKKGAYLINASRGKVIDIEVISKALNDDFLGGAAFDVYPIEPTKNTKNFYNSLQKCPNTILTPHMGGSTEEAQNNIGIDVAKKIVNFIKYGSTLGSVNFPEVHLPISKKTRLINIHQNIPGTLQSIHDILKNFNICNQILSTYKEIGITIIDLDTKLDDDILNQIQSLNSSISSRIL
jgi:D-3-phosphoglycerate dehydrogenase